MPGTKYDIEIAAFRAKNADLIRGFNFSDSDILTAVELVTKRGLAPTDKYVVAQLKLTRLGQLFRGEATE